jgi:PEP-CTERM motif
MKTILRAGCLILLLCGVSANSWANSITLTLNNGGNNTMGGVSVGPYNLTLTSGTKHTLVQLVCDDFKDNVYPGEHWNVKLSTFNSLLNVKWTGQTKNYEMVGWLVEQMFSPTYKSNKSAVADLQWAIWDIFDPQVSSHDPHGSISKLDQKSITNWLKLAQSNYGSGNYSNLVIYTAVSGSQVPFKDGPPQEYFGWNPPTRTPEPASLLLFSSGMLGLACLRRRWLT